MGCLFLDSPFHIYTSVRGIRVHSRITKGFYFFLKAVSNKCEAVLMNEIINFKAHFNNLSSGKVFCIFSLYIPFLPRRTMRNYKILRSCRNRFLKFITIHIFFPNLLLVSYMGSGVILLVSKL